MESVKTNQQTETEKNEISSNSKLEKCPGKIIEESENKNNENYNERISKRPTQLLSLDQLKIIKEQMETNLCKIYMKNKGYGSGFFCLIPFPDERNRLTVLITNNHVLNENDLKNDKVIKITLQNDQIEKNYYR